MNSKTLLVGLLSSVVCLSACTNKCNVGDAAGNDSSSATEQDAFNGKGSVYFGFNSANLTPKAQERVEAQAKVLKEKNKKAVVEGHADERGTADYNLALGSRRAESVKKHLLKNGVSQVVTVSYGKERPVISNASTEEEHAKNRRTVTIIQD